MERGSIEELIKTGRTEYNGIEIRWEGRPEFRVSYNPRIYYSSSFIHGSKTGCQRILFKKRFQENYSVLVQVDDNLEGSRINQILDLDSISVKSIKADRESNAHILELDLKNLEWLRFKKG